MARGDLKWRSSSPSRLSLQSKDRIPMKTLAPGTVPSFKSDYGIAPGSVASFQVCILAYSEYIPNTIVPGSVTLFQVCIPAYIPYTTLPSSFLPLPTMSLLCPRGQFHCDFHIISTYRIHVDKYSTFSTTYILPVSYETGDPPMSRKCDIALS